MDGRKKNGGARKGAGRKDKATEMGLQALLDKCWTVADRERCIRALAKTANDKLSNNRMEAVKILMGYTYGKPKETHEHSGKDGQAFEVRVILPKSDASG